MPDIEVDPEIARRAVEAILGRRQAGGRRNGKRSTAELLRALEPVGAQEIAERLGVGINTVYRWQQRGRLPVPAWKVSGRPAWPWAVIEQWARATGRLSSST